MKPKNTGSLVAERTLRVLLLFQNEKKLSLAEITKKLNISHTSTYRIVSTLKNTGFLIRDENKNYMLGSVFLRLARMVQPDLRSKALPILQELSKQTQESIYLSVSHNPEYYVFVEGVISPLPLKWSVEIGGYDVSYAGSAGKAHLASYSDEQLEDYFSTIVRTPFTPTTITDKENLLNEIKKIRNEGFSVSRGERFQGVIGISVPVKSFSSSTYSTVLSLYAPESRCDQDKILQLVSILKQAAKRI